MIRISCVVEGHGDVEAVPVVIKRIAQQVRPDFEVRVESTIRTPKSKLVKHGELERAVDLAARKLSGRGAVFVLLDSDSDCPGEVGPSLHARARSAREDIPVSVVLAQTEFESWFIASIESVAGHCGLPPGIQGPPDPEAIVGAKEWLTKQMEGGRAYSPALDQPKLARVFDIDAACRARSFEKLRRDVTRILQGLAGA